jgi:hypothetical protein
MSGRILSESQNHPERRATLFFVMASLDSVKLKIFRAVVHYKELEGEFEKYFQTNPAKVVRQQEGSPDQYVGKVEPKGSIPARLPLIIGDCLHNLRSSLDYLVWELVLAAKNIPGKDSMFPICSTDSSFKSQLGRGRLDGVHADAVTEIESLQPFQLGKDFDKAILWVMDDFCNINKHRRVLLTMLRGASGTIEETRIIDGKLWLRTELPRVDRDTKIGPFPIVNGGQVQVNTQIIAFVAFDEGAAQNMEVSLCLGGMLNYIKDDVVPRFERFF